MQHGYADDGDKSDYGGNSNNHGSNGGDDDEQIYRLSTGDNVVVEPWELKSSNMNTPGISNNNASSPHSFTLRRPFLRSFFFCVALHYALEAETNCISSPFDTHTNAYQHKYHTHTTLEHISIIFFLILRTFVS